jgi:hypothetical protein
MSASEAKAAIIRYRCHVALGPEAEIIDLSIFILRSSVFLVATEGNFEAGSPERMAWFVTNKWGCSDV